MTDEQIESVIEESDGHWHDGEFRIEGKDLMNLCRALLSASKPAAQRDACRIDNFWSGVCRYGTRSCVAEHAALEGTKE